MHKSLVNIPISIALIGFLFVAATSRVRTIAPPENRQSAADKIELHQALLDLSNPWTVMCVAAHPDDEDGATLTVLRRKYGVHTVSLFSTFGEGGQNAIGPELYEELGAIRAKETLKAAEIQGSEPHFLGLKDFGFSKSAEEAFRIWGHDEALRRMVLEIRKVRPDVIITNHDTTSGHGHHQATGRLVLEAFDVAADPNRFPEQLKAQRVWQVKRVFVRMSNSSGANSRSLDAKPAQTENVITIDRNERDPERDSTYAEQALHALQQHASQGPWPQKIPKEGWPPVRYQLVRQAKGSPPLSNDPKTFVDGLSLPRDIENGLLRLTVDHPLGDEESQQRNRLNAIAKSRDSLTRLSKLDVVLNSSMFQLFNERSVAAMAALSGITATIRSVNPTVVPDSIARVVLDITNNGTREVVIEGARIVDVMQSRNAGLPKKLAPNSTISLTVEPSISSDEPISTPRSAHLYDGRLFGKVLDASVRISVNGTRFSLPVSTTVDVSPAVEVENVTPSPYVLTPANRNQPLTFRVRLVNHQDKPFKGQFEVESKVTRIDRTGGEISLAANESRDFTLRTSVLSAADSPNRPGFESIPISVRSSENTSDISRQEVRVVYAEAAVYPGLRVGYVRSYDDTLRDALSALGVESKELSIDDIRTGDLQKFNTIIIDNRGYQAHPELVALNSRLLDFAKNGGTLIVFYHKTNEWNADPEKNRPSLAPYPITLGDERVTDENAAVTFTNSDHLLLNAPNAITAADFTGWIQERGLYFPKSWDSHYQTLFAMSDKGEESLRGGLLVADYERGHYIYTSMVWYRQLRDGLPGGYRMFGNLISYGASRVD